MIILPNTKVMILSLKSLVTFPLLLNLQKPWDKAGIGFAFPSYWA